jgi:hypothetical protein
MMALWTLSPVVTKSALRAWPHWTGNGAKTDDDLAAVNNALLPHGKRLSFHKTTDGDEPDPALTNQAFLAWLEAMVIDYGTHRFNTIAEAISNKIVSFMPTLCAFADEDAEEKEGEAFSILLPPPSKEEK